jgi:hypothetical protein
MNFPVLVINLTNRKIWIYFLGSISKEYAENYYKPLRYPPSVRSLIRKSHRKDFHEISYSAFVLKFVEKSEISGKIGQKQQTLTWRPRHFQDLAVLMGTGHVICDVRTEAKERIGYLNTSPFTRQLRFIGDLANYEIMAGSTTSWRVGRD